MSNQHKPRQLKLVPGKPNRVQVNVPMRFTLRTRGGTSICGIVTPNNPLIVTPGDDIVEYKIELQKELLGKPKSVK